MGHEEIRIPPQNQAAERAVLGAMLLDEDAIGAVIESLDSSFFYDASHQKIFEGIVKLYGDRKNVDIITLADRLKSDGVLESVGGAAFLAELADAVETERREYEENPDYLISAEQFAAMLADTD